jgi:deoxyribodipyrimidine photolyase-related protein
LPGTLRLVLGDQISDDRLSSLRDLDSSQDTVLLAEVSDETNYVRHHKQKIALVFAGMRGLAARLRAKRIAVRYIGFEDAGNSGSLIGELRRALSDNHFARVVVTAPGEVRLMAAFEAFAATSDVPVHIRTDDRYLCDTSSFAAWAEGRKELRMELFYREMRKRTGLLMAADGKPEGGAWNFDKENRKRMPRRLKPPPHRFVTPNAVTRTAIADVARLFPSHFGDLDGFGYPTTPDEADVIIEDFIQNILPGFGDYQDAMVRGEPWMWHSVISAAMNLGLIDPLAVCRRAESAYRDGRAPLNAVEGFIRQIIGWREFMRGIYWLKMPAFKTLNALAADRTLPAFYWTGDTDMTCVREAVATTRAHAYAHHIQRLMVTGNLAMLLGVHPDEINDWYMIVYADAYEWVELPNTHGMATFADGGLVGSKPYAASGAYIDRMSDYCGGCRYDAKMRLGADACPFNALYWDFLQRNRSRLSGNHRMAIVYKALAGMGSEERAAIEEEAARIKHALGANPRRSEVTKNKRTSKSGS